MLLNAFLDCNRICEMETLLASSAEVLKGFIEIILKVDTYWS